MIFQCDFLKLFFESWKGRHPMLLQIISWCCMDTALIEKYKMEGVIKICDNSCGYDYEQFEWVQKNLHLNL